MKLTATFRVHLPEPFLYLSEAQVLLRPPNPEELTFRTTIDRFEVEVRFADFSGSGASRAGEPMAGEVTKLSISVTGTVPDAPPTIVRAADGTINYSPLQEYLWKYQPEYRGVCDSVYERLARYFRFTQGIPLIRLRPDHGDPGLLNPAWTNEAGDIIWDTVTAVGGDAGAGLRLYPYAGVRAYSSADRSALLGALQAPIIVPLHEELLMEAKDAISDGNLRRAIIDLAVACEVGIKYRYFAPSTYAEAAYAYLEDKARVNARPIEFLDSIAARAFGTSLRDADPATFRNIDYLFRSRNKVAHRGTTTFKDDSGTEITPDRNLLIEWWDAAKAMLSWLQTNNRP